MRNEKTGDARVSGALASLVGLEQAVQDGDPEATRTAMDRILLLHSLILSFGGIPLLYYGDEVGTFNDCGYLDDLMKAADSRWIHRPQIDWQKVETRKQQGSVAFTLFSALKRLIAVRKETTAFADFNNRELLELDNPHLFAFVRTDHEQTANRVLVLCNFDGAPQHFDLELLRSRGFSFYQQMIDLRTGMRPTKYNDQLVLGPYQFYWLMERG